MDDDHDDDLDCRSTLDDTNTAMATFLLVLLFLVLMGSIILSSVWEVAK